MPKFNIAGISMEVISEEASELNKFKFFEVDTGEKCDIKINLKSCDRINKPQGKIVINENIQWVHGDDAANYLSACIHLKGTDIIDSTFSVNKKWDKAHTCFSKAYSSSFHAFSEGIGELFFRNFIVSKYGIIIHASSVEFEGRGIAFSAPSGTGKSTHACLWREHKGAKILNGDRTAVRIVDNKPYVYGIPWSGSSPDFLNRVAPLAAIVILEQAQENSIRLLDNKEIISRFLPRCSLPYCDNELMNMAIETIHKITSKTPVYLLKCRPEKAAVELAYKCIM